MIPRDFISVHGRVTWSLVPAAAAGTILAAADPDRYLLVIEGDNTIHIGIGRVPGETGRVFTVGSGDGRMVLTHALHGSLVNEAYVQVDPVVAATAVVIVGRMPPSRKLARRGENESA